MTRDGNDRPSVRAPAVRDVAVCLHEPPALDHLKPASKPHPPEESVCRTNRESLTF